MLTVALLGLGEAGSRLAASLMAAGVDVRGYDPDAARDAPGLTRAPDPKTAVAGSDVVLSVNTAREVAAVIGGPLLERLVQGTRKHAARRMDEMEAARDLLQELGIEPRIAAATASLLGELAAPAN